MTKQLRGGDAIFLSIEGPTYHIHIGAVLVISPSKVKGFGFEKVLRKFEERIDRIPKFTWRLREVPLGLDCPYWEESKCCVADHLHRVSLPAPGDERELTSLVGELFSHPLDRSRPLWEAWYIEGLARNRVAILMKIHHCLFDGVSGAELARVLTDLEPEPTPEPKRKRRRAKPSPERPLSDGELWTRSWFSLMGTPYKVGSWLGQLGWRSVSMLPSQRKYRDLLPAGAPRTRFNDSLSSERSSAFARVSLTDVKEIKRYFDVKINDVILALCGTALRRYLAELGELPEQPLVAGVPISTHQSGDDHPENQVGVLSVSLETQLEDPVERLLAIHERSQAAKEIAAQFGATNVQAMASAFPPVAIELLSWIVTSTKLDGKLPLTANTIISNIPGSPVPLYICGGAVEAIYPLAPVMVGMGLSITVMSYTDGLYFGFMMDPKLVPDPWQLAEGVEIAVDELKRAIGCSEPTRRGVRATQ